MAVDIVFDGHDVTSGPVSLAYGHELKAGARAGECRNTTYTRSSTTTPPNHANGARQAHACSSSRRAIASEATYRRRQLVVHALGLDAISARGRQVGLEPGRGDRPGSGARRRRRAVPGPCAVAVASRRPPAGGCALGRRPALGTAETYPSIRSTSFIPILSNSAPIVKDLAVYLAKSVR